LNRWDEKSINLPEHQCINFAERYSTAPLQEVRSFNTDNPGTDGWRNMLIFGDNLMALKSLYDDQRGANLYGTKNRIKLVYIESIK
jgi:hypothetical protein